MYLENEVRQGFILVSLDFHEDVGRTLKEEVFHSPSVRMMMRPLRIFFLITGAECPQRN